MKKADNTTVFFSLLFLKLEFFSPKRATRLNEKNKRLGVDFINLCTWGQFHQRSICSFYVRKFRTQLFCAHVLVFYFTGARLLAQKQRLEHW